MSGSLEKAFVAPVVVESMVPVSNSVRGEAFSMSTTSSVSGRDVALGTAIATDREQRSIGKALFIVPKRFLSPRGDPFSSCVPVTPVHMWPRD